MLTYNDYILRPIGAQFTRYLLPSPEKPLMPENAACYDDIIKKNEKVIETEDR